eukprot:gene3123-2296_t
MFSSRFRTSFKTAFASTFKQQKRSIFNAEKPFSRENLPFYGAAVGLTAFSFQVMVLYPWHEELSTQFSAIQNAIGHMERFSKSLDDKMDKVMALEEQVKLKERKILLREEEILATEMQVIDRLEKLTALIQSSNQTVQEKKDAETSA